jgi:hypothetical protein
LAWGRSHPHGQPAVTFVIAVMLLWLGLWCFLLLVMAGLLLHLSQVEDGD